ncbi:carboxymuconolactone decarboxylase family protein [Streptomyces sp. SP17BM10]|uniref:carboxymuconolactone decarboxylase family protein n=1 Tax=Streptomyces sp. SP17BM10 TaxID=3002530 RepID=UPI002E766343|nr:carboxymuconolactone decarboxylase family protein [Streptomyces sp. SP17BM10]MEE1784546.1 carboxymuconolactone decarboxylase family protein [Streptomyces sp. SP17BM10]
MAAPLLRVALRGALGQVRHVAPVRPARAGAPVARVYAEVEREFGVLAPPVALHAPSPEVLAAAWTMLRETLVAAGRADRAQKEAVAAAVSRANACPYCVEVHTTAIEALGGSAGESAMEPLSPSLVPELVGVAATFHYLNRMVSLFLGDSPMPPGAPAAARRAARAVLGRLARQGADAAPSPGGSLDLLPAARLPEDLRWAAGTPSIAGAFARAAAVIDEGGERAVPAPVRELVTAELAAWDGTPPGLSRAWLEPALSSLPPEHRAAGRLALLTAKAAYQVDDAVIAAARHTDAQLIELTAWTSLTTARLLAARLVP